MVEGKTLWEIRLGVVASEADARAIADQIERLLCPNPDHAPPCRIPWSLSLCAGTEMSPEDRAVYDDVVAQYRIESGADPR